MFVIYSLTLQGINVIQYFNMNNRIKFLLNERNMTAKELAELSGISRVSLSNIMTGKQEASANTLNTIAEKLSVPFWQLFTAPDEVSEKPELTALIRFRGQLYQADSIKELENVVKWIREEGER